MREFNLVLAGVGGQGVLLAAEIIGTAAIKDGFNVRVGEIHGMAQRGGAVVSHVRIGEKVFAPTILDGRADVILGFEPIETLRNLNFASEKTIIIMNDEKIPPPELTIKMLRYPSLEEIIKKIRHFTENIIVIDAAKLAEEAGNIQTENVVMIGALTAAQRMPVKETSIIKAIRELVPKKYVEVNVKAFKLGCEHVKRKINVKSP
ncbi:MAG: indolepyruvate ferredoxin oxidoreductase subunit beta [Candidatus Bathyarchaeia archaeon]